MIQKMFTIFDQKAKAYLPPFCMVQDGQALRAFSDCVNDATHAFYRNPGDYTLMEIGAYDDSNASIKQITPIVLGLGLEFKKPIQQEKIGV